jgi:serine/threonine-protein kinase
MLTDRSASDAQLSNLDSAATLALCNTLAEYGEAGALSHDLMLRAGQYATSRFGDDLDILLAAARMYQLGDETELARKVLLRAGKLAPDETRTLRQLGDVLRALGLPVTPALAIAEAADEAPSPPPSRAQSHVRVVEEREAPVVEAPEARVERSILPPRAVEPSKRPSQRPTRQIPAQRPDEELPPYDRFADAQTLQMRSHARPADRAASGLRTLDREGRDGAPKSARSLVVTSEGTLGAGANRIRMLDASDPTRRLDRYELIGEIASGGMATVFLARRDGAGGFQRLVALKRLHPHLAHQQEFVEMFLDEARLAAAIHHPHVVPILESENGNYVVMEFIEGDTLAGLASRALARGVLLPRAVAVRIVLDTLSGLHAAHQLKDGEGRLLGLVHRDCTPQNILVGSDGSSRLTDFGVARAASRLAITRSHMVKGKVAYLSPEQATAGDLDRRSDIFTMGIVLWEMLTGRSLFQTDTESMTISRLLTGTIPPVRKEAPDVSPELEEVCMRALQRNPAHRYATAAAMGDALEAATRTAIGGAASPAEVGRCVEMLIGVDLAAQREAVRVWATQHESSPESRRRNGLGETPIPSPASSRPEPPPPFSDEASSPPAKPPPLPFEPTVPRVHVAKLVPAPMLQDASAALAPSATPPSATAAPAPAVAIAIAVDPAAAKRRLRTRLTVAAIVFVGASSPVWLKPVTHLREKLFAHGKTAAGTERPRRTETPAPTATADAPADPAADR